MTQRCVVFSLYLSSSVEWRHSYPPGRHRYLEIPAVSN